MSEAEIAPGDLSVNSRAVLEAVDRELAFFRRRAGQVFFLSLLIEVLILGGRESIAVQPVQPWIKPLSYSILFIAVATVGIVLGREYRARIHVLKHYRSGIIRELVKEDTHPPIGGLRLSEIEMLYVVLVFLSSCGIILVWLNGLDTQEDFPPLFWVFFGIFTGGGTLCLGWAAMKLGRWLLADRRSKVALEQSETDHDA